MNQNNATRTVLSQFPDAPIGTTMFSRFVLYHLMSGNCSISDSKRLLFNNSKCRSLSSFGEQIPAFMAALPHTTNFDRNSYLLHATAFVFYRDSLSDSYRKNWLNRDGKKFDFNKNEHQFFAGRAHLKLVKQHLHFCSDCVTDDDNVFGVAFWRVLHQIPGIHHCPVHLSPLNGVCQSCDRAQASQLAWNLPAKKCPFCQSSIFKIEESRLSSAYSVYLSLCKSMIHDNEPDLTQEQRRKKYTDAYQFFGLIENPLTLQNVIDVVLKQWNCNNLIEVENLLGVSFNLNVVGKVLSGDSKFINPISQLAILAASIAAKNTISTKPCVKAEQGKSTLIKTIEVLQKLGFEKNIAHLFLDGKTENYIAANQNMSWNKVRELRIHLHNMNLINYSQKDYGSGKILKRFGGEYVFRRKNIRITNPLQTYRERVLQAVEKGNASRQYLKLTDAGALNWLRKYDSEWLNKILPATMIFIRDPSQKRSIYREHILIFMNEQPNTTRSNIDKNLRTQFRWCFLNDTEWLNKVVPGAGIIGRRANSKVPIQVTKIGVGLKGKNS